MALSLSADHFGQANFEFGPCAVVLSFDLSPRERWSSKSVGMTDNEWELRWATSIVGGFLFGLCVVIE